MFIIKAIRWLFGYVVISVEGDFCERFLNLMARGGISLWNVRRKSLTRLVMCVKRRDFPRLRDIARKSSCRVRIIQKTGFSFIAFRHRRRKLFAISAVIFFGLIMFLSSLLWRVEVPDTDYVDKETITQSLGDEGLRPGVPVRSLDLDRIKNNMLLKHDEISWISINMKGTRAQVELRPRTSPPDIIDKNEACNIVAAYDAVIEKLEVLMGEADVISGEAVTEGQLLVGGVIDSEIEGIRLVHSIANIEGRVWITKRESSSKSEVVKEYTGQEDLRRAVRVLGVQINLFVNSSIPYEKYDKINSEQSAALGDFELPATLLTARFLEYSEKSVPIDESQAKKTLKEHCDSAFSADHPGIMPLGEEVRFEETENGYTMEVTYECIIPIGEKRRIVQ